MNNVLKTKRGITLIALIITIIVLLVLAGVALATLTGNNNIIENANKAVEKYNEKTNEEQGILGELEEKLKEYTEKTTPVEDYDADNLKVDEKGLATANIRIKPSSDNENNLQIVIPTGFAPAILQTGTTQSLPGQDGSVKNKMPASEWNNITAEDINKGIVVVDGDENEFVWIPILDASKFARVAWTTKAGYDENGIWATNTQHQLAEISTENKWWEDKTKSEYNQMEKSVRDNKGFYLARYEASKSSNSDKAQSKRNATIWNNISQTDAITKSANYNSTLHSHLIYGIEWDSILNWLNGNATISSSTNGETKTMELSDIQTDSCSWGNYSNSTGDASINSKQLQTSGTSEYWKANNLYDLAGNVDEWTQEKYSTGTGCASRGGLCEHNGDDFSTAFRSLNGERSQYNGLGFRFSFYL